MNLNKYTNKKYSFGSAPSKVSWYVLSMLFFETAIPWPYAIKRFILRFYGAKVGRKVIIKPKVWIKYPWFLKIGDYSWIGRNVQIDNLALVEIGKNTCISQDACLLTGNHNFRVKTFDLIINPIIIQDEVWIGAYCKIMPGSIIKKSSVLQANITFKGTLDSNVVIFESFNYQTKKRY